ncbi:MAG TPA: hypothetical protein VGW38_00290, partial [Chloroflexota bacterium]|nr:hypothetical protein [Chloroflexota bacterium]
LPAKRRKMKLPCLRLGQGLCAAPCAELITAEHYDEMFRFACQYLTAGREATLAAVDARLRELAGLGEHQSPIHHLLRAARARLLRVKREERPLPGGFAGGTVVMVYPDADGQPVAYVVQDGRLVARRVLDGDSTDDALAGHVQAWQAAEPLLDLHQTNILLRWIFQHVGDAEIVPPSE